MTQKRARRTASGLEIGDNPRRSIALSFDLGCSKELQPLIELLTDRAANSGALKLRPSSLAKLSDAFDLLLANLLTAYRCHPQAFVGASLNRGDYSVSRYRSRTVGYDSFDRALRYLVKASFVSYLPGFNDPRSNKGRTSRVKANGVLRRILDRYRLVAARNRLPDNLNALFDRLHNPLPLDQRLTIPQSWVVALSSAEVIRLKNPSGNLAKYVDDDETKTMRKRLQQWNDFVANHHHVDLLKSDEDTENLFFHSEYDDEDDVAASYGDERDRPEFVQFERFRLHRVFNNNSIQEGGRFYGAWWQRIPSDARRYITINDKPTKEFDYSNLHAAMLYARKGLPLREDAYLLDGVDEKYRTLIKATFFRLINAKKGQKIQAPMKKLLPPRMSWKELQEAVREKHHAIADSFNTGEGLKLQRVDADIAEDVMLSMMRKDYLALPIHDSFIVYSGLGPVIKAEMSRAYVKAMNREIGIKADPTFFEIERTKSPPNEGDYEPDAEEHVEWRAEEPGYEGYRAKRDAFLRSRTDEWERRFGRGRGM